MKKVLYLLIGCLFLVACNNEATVVDNPVDQQIEALYMPKSITGYSSNTRAISNISTADWKSFYIVPQIGNNYNSWVEKSVLHNVKDLSKNKAGMNTIDSDLYDLKWESYDSNSKLKEVFMASQNFSKWTYIVHTNGGEIRQILFRKENDTKHLLALFYRKNVDDMNDIVEIIETPNKLITKCIRTYDISKPEQTFLNFASITDLQGPKEETTGVIFTKNNSGTINLDSLFKYSDIFTDIDPASPAVFDNNNYLLEESAITGYSNHPDKDEVLGLVFEGINNKDVAEVVIDPITLESTLDFSSYQTTISSFDRWGELNNANPQSNVEVVGEWSNLETIPQTFHNYSSIKDQALLDINIYLDSSVNMDILSGHSDYNKEVYITDNFRFQANDSFTKWKYTKKNGVEIRQFIYLKDDSVTPVVEYYYALFYRKDVDDMNDLVVIKTSEDKITYAASMRVYNISTDPNHNNTYFIQHLDSDKGLGISISNLDDTNFSYFNKEGVQVENTSAILPGYPSLEDVKVFGNSIPNFDLTNSISISGDLNGGLELTSQF